ncbi:hypothetical protein MIMGU_mgv1a013896mg [Erythranthe guttata]|uniref:Uncharacterized protein n=1 Tax=Erythranthe guttata TaxID=4155 RepID=A0A022PXJ2_ERYGU|nr:hypothetical protein MIMGU_mgv1a013896mg [Erythranthe guttata]
MKMETPVVIHTMSRPFSLLCFLSLQHAFVLKNISYVSLSTLLSFLDLGPSMAPSKITKLSIPVRLFPSISSICMLTSFTRTCPISVPPQVTTTPHCTMSPPPPPPAAAEAETMAYRSCMSSDSQWRRASTACRLATLTARFLTGSMMTQLTLRRSLARETNVPSSSNFSGVVSVSLWSRRSTLKGVFRNHAESASVTITLEYTSSSS